MNNVKITDDLKIAKIYISFLENKKSNYDVIEIIKSKHNIIRYHLGKSLTLKFTPHLRFYYDDTLEHVQKINNLMQKINSDD